MRANKFLSALVAAAFPLAAAASSVVTVPPASEQFATLREIVQKAVANNPEVAARWHSFRAAAEEVGVAQGGYSRASMSLPVPVTRTSSRSRSAACRPMTRTTAATTG